MSSPEPIFTIPNAESESQKHFMEVLRITASETRNGASLEKKDSAGKVIGYYHLATQTAYNLAIEDGQDFNYCDEAGDTSAHIAASGGKNFPDAILREIMEKTPLEMLNVKGNFGYGKTPWALALESGNDSAFIIMIGKSGNAKQELGYCPINFNVVFGPEQSNIWDLAIQSGSVKVLKILANAADIIGLNVGVDTEGEAFNRAFEKMALTADKREIEALKEKITEIVKRIRNVAITILSLALRHLLKQIKSADHFLGVMQLRLVLSEEAELIDRLNPRQIVNRNLTLKRLMI